jgi:hypothetical protein
MQINFDRALVSRVNFVVSMLRRIRRADLCELVARLLLRNHDAVLNLYFVPAVFRERLV